MRKNTLNFIVDCTGLIAMQILLTTGLLITYVLPPGSRGGHGLTLLGWDRHTWGDVHFWTAITLVGLMVLHVLLHWAWVCDTVRRFVSAQFTPGKRPLANGLYGVGFLVLLIVLNVGLLAYAGEAVKRDGEGEPGHGSRGSQVRGGHERHDEHDTHGAGQHVRGSATIGEVAAQFDLTPGAVKALLGLPESVADDARLGRACREAGISMSEAREMLNALGQP